MYYCGCDIVLHSVVAVSDDDEVPPSQIHPVGRLFTDQ